MTRLVVLTTPELADGYRLAGVAVCEVASPAEAAERLEELLESEHGVIALHAPYFHALARPLRRRLDALRAPAGRGASGGHDARGGRRPPRAAAQAAPPGRRLRDHLPRRIENPMTTLEQPLRGSTGTGR